MNCSAPMDDERSRLAADDDTPRTWMDAGAQRHCSRSNLPLIWSLLAIATIVAALCCGGGS